MSEQGVCEHLSRMKFPSEPWHQGGKNSLSEAPARRRKRVLVINGAHSGRGARFRLPATSDLRGLMSTGRVIHSAVICWTHPSSLALFLFSAGPLRADQENLAPSRAHIPFLICGLPRAQD